MPQLETPLDVADLVIQLGHARPLLAKGVDDHRRQPLRDPLQGRPDPPSYPGPALRHHLAVLSQQAAQPVDLRGAELHQLLAHPMQRQDRLLLLALDGHRLDAGLLHRRPDRPRVMRVALVTDNERPDHLRRQQPDLVVKFPQPPRPMLCAAARLHRDQTRHAVGEVLQKLRPRQLQVHDLAGLHIDPMQLEHPLRRIHADNSSTSLHLGPSGLPGKTRCFPLGTLMPSAREGPPLSPPVFRHQGREAPIPFPPSDGGIHLSAHLRCYGADIALLFSPTTEGQGEFQRPSCPACNCSGGQRPCLPSNSTSAGSMR